MRSIKVHEAKTNLSKLIEQACRGEEVIIARGKTPVVRLIPIGEVRGRRQPGALRGKLRVGPEFFEPLPSEELSAWE
jgi:prevent-host-death family protein